MKKFISNLALPLKTYIGFSLLSSAIIIILILAFGREFIPPEVPLFYGRSLGEEQVVTREALVLPSLVAIAVTLINSLLSLVIDDKFLKKTLILAAFAVSIFASVTTLKIILLIGSF